MISHLISVVTCSHNPNPQYFKRVLNALRAQALPVAQWEYLVVDNCSRIPIADSIDLSWHPYSRIVREDKLGLTPARLKGISEANSAIIVFVDDDNLLDPDYLDQVLRSAEKYPHLGSWSGQCRGEFEEVPSEWIYRYLGNLAIREFNKNIWSNLPRLAETMPCGAGMVVSRPVAQRYLERHSEGERSFQLDRAGDSLLSGGDNDLAACACEIGLSVGLVASLKLTHLIPPERLTSEYQARLAEGIHFSSVILDSYYGITPSRRSIFGRLIDAMRVMRLPSPHRQILAAAYRGRNRALRQLTSYPR
jgi:glycosyltransferase involved in cell wall biosynthesis